MQTTAASSSPYKGFRYSQEIISHAVWLYFRFRFSTQAVANLAIFQYIEGWYNPHRLHSALGYESPVSFERRTVQVLEQVA